MKLYQTLESQLKKEPNYVSDNGELKKWVVLNKAQNFDEELIGLLLDNSDLKQKFFIEIKSTLIFSLYYFTQYFYWSRLYVIRLLTKILFPLAYQ